LYLKEIETYLTVRSMQTQMDRRLRIGVLGAGPIAQFAHVEACRKAGNAELYAICDVAPDLLAQMAEQHSPTTTFLDFDELLADPAVDAVLVAVADQFHVPAASRAIASGKHVLVEKPLGVDVAECERLADEVHESGLVLQVGTMRRFDEGIAFARDFIAEELGELIALKAWYCDSAYRYTMTDALQPMPRVSSRARRPDGDPKSDRRRYLMLGHGSHLVDTARYLAGDISTVMATFVERAGARCWFAQVEFASGAVGHLDLTMSVQMDWHEGFHAYGERGSVVAKTFLPWYLRTSEVECFSARDRRYHRPLGEDSHFFRRQVEGFADAILNDAPMRGATVDDGLAAMRVMAAIEESARNGVTVSVASQPATAV
jgi:predicted dehydrogenase